jgi:hypothetical protein
LITGSFLNIPDGSGSVTQVAGTGFEVRTHPAAYKNCGGPRRGTMEIFPGFGGAIKEEVPAFQAGDPNLPERDVRQCKPPRTLFIRTFEKEDAGPRG